MRYSMEQRTREIGIRVAVGAEPRQVLAMVLRQGAVITTAGLAAGTLFAFWMTQLMGPLPSQPLRNSVAMWAVPERSNLLGVADPLGVLTVHPFSDPAGHRAPKRKEFNDMKKAATVNHAAAIALEWLQE